MSRISYPIKTNAQFEEAYAGLAEQLNRQEPFDRGEVHAQKITDPAMHTRELLHVNLRIEVDREWTAWQRTISPNLPWAEDHFQERVGGEPLNPPPAEAWWPYAQQGNAAHKKAEIFSHTYPERFWPKSAGHMGQRLDYERMGIRFPYGDLRDVVEVLRKNPRSRQAYLPIWFPEDGAAALQGERVPCTLGYHFIQRADGKFDCVYTMRSCDAVRFLRDDIYMAGRLLQWVCEEIKGEPGELVMHIDNLHCFVGDEAYLASVVRAQTKKSDRRSSYNFGAMM